MTQLPHHAAQSPQATVTWSFTEPPSTIRSSKLQLLTIGAICVTGTWYGELGEYFVAWAPLLKIDKDLFNATIQAYQTKLNQTHLTH